MIFLSQATSDITANCWPWFLQQIINFSESVISRFPAAHQRICTVPLVTHCWGRDRSDKQKHKLWLIHPWPRTLCIRSFRSIVYSCTTTITWALFMTDKSLSYALAWEKCYECYFASERRIRNFHTRSKHQVRGCSTFKARTLQRFGLECVWNAKILCFAK